MRPESNVTVFLSQCSSEQSDLRNELSSVLQRAGMNVIPREEHYKTEAELVALQSQLGASNCSLHIIFPQFGPLTSSGDSIAKLQFQAAKSYLAANPDFKIFVWLPPTTDILNIESSQLSFINEVKNNISKNMVFSNAISPIQLVDDIRSLMETKEIIEFDLNSTSWMKMMPTKLWIC